MRETLFIRLRDAAQADAAAAPLSAALWSATSGYRDVSAPLAELAAQAANARVIAFVSADDVRLTLLDVPARSAQKVLQAAPYVLEEQIAEDVETLHFAVGARMAAGGYPVAIVAQSRMTRWLELLQAHGLPPDALVPEQLALPWSADDRAHLLDEAGRVIARTGAYQSFSCQLDDLPAYLQIADPDHRYGLRVFITAESAGEYTEFERPVELLPGHRGSLEVLVKHWQEAGSINLLQGAFSPRRQMNTVWGPWRVPAALAAAWFGLSLGTQAIQTYTLNREARRQDASNVQQYQSLFPEEQRIVDLSAQAEQKSRALRAGGGQRGVLQLIEPITQALKAVPGLDVQNLQYREGAIYLSLSGRDLQALERLRTWFGEHPGTLLDVQSANSGADGVQIRLKLSPA